MKYIFGLIKKLLIGIWDFIFYLIGAPYEEQAGMKRMLRLEVQKTKRLKKHITEPIK